jgi:hypothetical protein
MAVAHIFLELLEVAKAIQYMHLSGIYLWQAIDGVRIYNFFNDPTEFGLNTFVRMLLSLTPHLVLEFRDAVYFYGNALTSKRM